MREWADDRERPARRRLYDDLVNRTAADFPGCMAEMRGVARGAGLEEDAVVMNNLRNELYMLINYGNDTANRRGDNARAGRSCTDVYLVTAPRVAGGERGDAGGESLTTPPFAGFAHNDDWTMDWRNLSYIVQLDDSDGAFLWSSWAYPGFLPGMDFLVNRHGLMASVQTLMPEYVQPHGVAAWGCVTRRLIKARSLEEAMWVVRWPDATAGGFAVNLGWHRAPPDGADSNPAAATLVNVETYVDPSTNKTGASSLVVHNGTWKPLPPMHSMPKALAARSLLSRVRPATGGVLRRGGEKIIYFHGIEYRHAPLDIAYRPSESTRHRQRTFLGARDAITDQGGLRDFLGNASDGRFPVYRTARPGDEVWTEATGLFDVGAGDPGILPPGAEPDRPESERGVRREGRVSGRRRRQRPG